MECFKSCLEWIIMKSGVCILNDVYNFSLIVLKMVLKIFMYMDLSGKFKYLVFVDMLEFGDLLIKLY